MARASSIEPRAGADQRAGTAAQSGQARARAPGARVKASLEHALLGLIAEQRMLSGYDLVKQFDLSMVHYWHAHHGQIYPTLERMTRRGWIRRRDVIQKRRPNKRVYTITPEGRRYLMEWIQSPFEGIRLKHAPLLRCRFLAHLGAEGARRKLEEERAACAGYRERFAAIERKFFGRGYRDANEMFSYFTLRRGIMMMEENVAWCDWAIEQIASHPGLFAKAQLSGSGGDAPSRRPRRRAAGASASGGFDLEA